MKLLAILSIGLLTLPRSSKVELVNSFPSPPISPNTLFFIQRSTNANTVMYELNLLKDNTINPKDPVHVYWLRYTEGPKKKGT